MKKIASSSVLFLFTVLSYGQGFSDAGICTIGSGFDRIEEKRKNTVEIATVFAAGESDLKYFSPSVSYTRQFNEKFALSTRITFSSATGGLGTRAAFGDAYLIGNYAFSQKNKKQWSALFGWKFPFTASNLKINGYSLPLDYQSSLGTFDLFLGTNFKYRQWDFNVAVQIPVFNNNKNSYFKEYAITNDFSTTNLFERQSDALFRTSYTLNTKNQKFSFKPNVLLIYHLGEDRFENIFGKRETIPGSEGLTVNGNLISAYHLSKQKSVELSVATPFVVRDVRPDGLTRSLVLAIQYNYSF